MSCPSAANIRRGSLYTALRNLRPQQSINFLPQRFWTMCAAIEDGSAVRLHWWEFPCPKLKGNHPQRVVIFHGSAPTSTSIANHGWEIIPGSPGRNFLRVDAMRVFEIDQPELTAMNKNVGGLAIAPDPASEMNFGQKGFELVQDLCRSVPRSSDGLDPMCG